MVHVCTAAEASREGGDIAVDQVLVDAIETIAAVIGQAADGDDPFLLKDSSVELTFTVTDTGRSPSA